MRTLFITVAVVLAGLRPAAAAGTLAALGDRGIDLDGDGFYECLALEVEARVPKPGTYLVHPILSPPDPACNPDPFVLGMSEEQFAAWKEGREFVDDLNDTFTGPFDDMGTMRVTTSSRKLRFALYFDGEELRDLDADGPWTLCAHLLLQDNFDPETEEPHPGTEAVEMEPRVTTRPWSRGRFGRGAAYGSRVDWQLEPDSTAIRLHVELDVHRADPLRVHVTAAYDDFAAESLMVVVVRPGPGALDVRLAPRSREGHPSTRMTSERVRLRIQGLSFSGPGGRVPGWDGGHRLWETGPWKHSRDWLYR